MGVCVWAGVCIFCIYFVYRYYNKCSNGLSSDNTYVYAECKNVLNWWRHVLLRYHFLLQCNAYGSSLKACVYSFKVPDVNLRQDFSSCHFVIFSRWFRGSPLECSDPGSRLCFHCRNLWQKTQSSARTLTAAYRRTDSWTVWIQLLMKSVF